jgi:dihydrofolate synthase/folylpolyglutamate synthase
VQWLERYQNAIEERGLTYFEIVTAMALHYFADRGCDAVVLEVGLGGRLDATTAITPSLCVVTSVGFDHMDVLGNTIEDIWEEKIGILKPGIPMVTGEKRAHLISRLHERAKALASPIYVIENSLPQSMFASNPGITSKVTQWNCTLAWKALECWEKHVSVKELSQDRVQSDMEKCLSKITPALGRQTYIQSSMNTSAPPLLLDGAHNAEGVDALKHFVQKLPTRKWIVLYASMSDKDWERGLVVAEAIAGKGHKKIFQTLPQYSRALSYETMRRSEYCQDTSNWKCWDEALSQEKTSELLLEAKREGKGILVFGSFYLLGEFIPFLVDVYPELNWYKQFREEWEGDINP